MLIKAPALSLFIIPFVYNAALISPDYPGYNIKEQRLIKGETRERIPEPRQAQISVGSNILQADISIASKAQILTQPDEDKLG